MRKTGKDGRSEVQIVEHEYCQFDLCGIPGKGKSWGPKCQAIVDSGGCPPCDALARIFPGENMKCHEHGDPRRGYPWA